MQLTLLSRTIGADRVVDEMHVDFKHTEEMPWILPGVPATNKRVEILVVSIVTIRGGKLYHEHVYWDQASVLLQTGLLDRKLVSEAARKSGIEKLPVVGKYAARRVLNGWDGDEGEAGNELIPEWNDDDNKAQDNDNGKVGRVAEKSAKEESPNEKDAKDDGPSKKDVKEGAGDTGAGEPEPPKRDEQSTKKEE